MLTTIQIDTIVDCLNKFQESYRNYDVCFLTTSQLTQIIGTSNFSLLLKLLNITKFNQGNDVVDCAALKPYECAIDPLFCKLNASAASNFRRMNNDLDAAAGTRLLIVSGYRSAAYQLMIVAKEIYEHDFNLIAALRTVALPGKSEHQATLCTAIDFDIDDNKDQRYHWLVKHAATYGFTLSYGINNRHGMQFEPWHWRYNGL